MNSSHPEKQCLVDYTSGILNDQQAQEVARHLDECTTCEATIRSLEAQSDTFVEGLREPRKEQPLLQESPYLKTVDKAIKLAGADAEKPLPPAVENKAAPAAEKKLGPYVILAKLGEGGMGAVFKARHEHLGKVVAIKVLPKMAMQDPAAVARFRREMLAVGQLHHPNIVIAFDAGEAQGIHYLTMEYVEGSDLSTIIKKSGPVTIEQAISYMTQAAKGLAFAHSKNIVHRDIKPANLLVDAEGTVKILDMGLARLDDCGAANAEANQGLTQTGQVMGTVDYMAPEQAFDTHRADAKADVYSLGCTLYRILTGQNSYGGETIVQKILAHREQPIPSLAKLCPQTPAALDALYQRMMAKRPEDRPTMAEVAKELEAIANPQAAAASVPAIVIDVAKKGAGDRGPGSGRNNRLAALLATRVSPSRSNRRSKPPVKLIAGGIGGFALIIAGVIWFIIRDKDGNELARIAAPEGSNVQVVAGSAAVKVVPPPVAAPTATTPSMAISPFDAAQARARQQAWAAYLGTTVETKNSVGMRMTLLPPGEFMMGSTPEQVAAAMKMGEEDKILPADNYYRSMPGEMPQHKVRFRRPLLIGTTEVTVAQFRNFAESSQYVTEAEKYGFGDGQFDDKYQATRSEAAQKANQGLNWRSPGNIFTVSDDHPVTQISWNDAAVFCNWLSEQEGRQPWYRPDGKGSWLAAAYADGYRLPTEAEWEYACRAGTTTHFSFGDDKSQLERYGWFSKEAGNKMHPVALKLPNPFGLFDMHGNAEEWCHDFWDLKWYEKSPSDDPVCTSKSDWRVIRGGYLFRKTADARSAYRTNSATPTSRHYNLGFRIVRPLEPQASAVKPRVAAPLTDVNSPAFQAWLKATQALPAEKQLEAVSKKLMELNPGFDGKLTGFRGPQGPGTGTPKVDKGVVTEVGLITDNLTDLSPLRAFPGLQSLRCVGGSTIKGKLTDLSPLTGVPLTKLEVDGNPGLSDLSALRGMKLTNFSANYTAITQESLLVLKGMLLTYLHAGNAEVSDLAFVAGMPLEIVYISGSFSNLSPLAGMRLRSLGTQRSRVTDLSPLKGMPLTILGLRSAPLADLSPLVECTDLKSLNVQNTKVTAEQVAALQKALPGCKIEWDDPAKKSAKSLAYRDPAFQQWVEATQKLPADQQLEAVSKKLMELNPGFDGKLEGIDGQWGGPVGTPTISNGVVTKFGFYSDYIADISPVRALTGLTQLSCKGSKPDVSQLSDLSPLKGMKLTYLGCANTRVSDLSPLEGMPLTRLWCGGSSELSDLTPLRGLPLTMLTCRSAPVSDLSPLRGMPLTHLDLTLSKVSDLSPLKELSLTHLTCFGTSVSDLSSLEGCQSLKSLEVGKTKVTAEQVAMLQKALPDCKVKWDDPAKTPAKP